MPIYGLSQSSGVERRLEVEKTGDDVSLIIYDHPRDEERDRIVVPSEDLLSAIIGREEGGSTIEGTAPAVEEPRRLDVAVLRNEVQLRTHGGGQEDCDIAVGLDDLQDALEGVMG